MCLVHIMSSKWLLLIMRTSNPRQVAPATGAPFSPVTVTAGWGSNLKSTYHCSTQIPGDFLGNTTCSTSIWWFKHFGLHLGRAAERLLWQMLAPLDSVKLETQDVKHVKHCHLHFTFISNFPGCPKDVQPCSTYEASSVSKKPRVAVVTCTN